MKFESMSCWPLRLKLTIGPSAPLDDRIDAGRIDREYSVSAPIVIA
jgi:hypothetical protein